MGVRILMGEEGDWGFMTARISDILPFVFFPEQNLFAVFESDLNLARCILSRLANSQKQTTQAHARDLSTISKTGHSVPIIFVYIYISLGILRKERNLKCELQAVLLWPKNPFRVDSGTSASFFLMLFCRKTRVLISAESVSASCDQLTSVK